MVETHSLTFSFRYNLQSLRNTMIFITIENQRFNANCRLLCYLKRKVIRCNIYILGLELITRRSLVRILSTLPKAPFWRFFSLNSKVLGLAPKDMKFIGSNHRGAKLLTTQTVCFISHYGFRISRSKPILSIRIP